MPSYLITCSNFIQRSLERFFGSIGKLVGHHPWKTIVLSVFACLLFGLGFMNWTTESRAEKLWIPQNSVAEKQSEWVSDVFGYESRTAEILLKPKNNGNVLTAEYMQQYWIAHYLMVNFSTTALKAYQSEFPGYYSWDGYQDSTAICMYRGSQCDMQTIFDIIGYSYNDVFVTLTTTLLLQSINNANEDTLGFTLDSILGGIQRDPSNNEIASAVIVRGEYTIAANVMIENNEYIDPSREKWEVEVNDILLSTSFADCNVISYFQESFSVEFSKGIGSDLSSYGIGCALLIIYTALALGKRDYVHSMVGLALCAILTVGLSILMSWGFAGAFAIIYTPLSTTLPFLILGLGVDDAFIIAGEFQQQTKQLYAQKLSPAKRMEITMKHAGVSILITSLTDFMAFSIGASTILPALESFCLYAALGVFAVFWLNCTFFAACVVIDAQRAEANRVDYCLCCCKLQTHHPMFPELEALRAQPPNAVDKDEDEEVEEDEEGNDRSSLKKNSTDYGTTADHHSHKTSSEIQMFHQKPDTDTDSTTTTTTTNVDDAENVASNHNHNDRHTTATTSRPTNATTAPPPPPLGVVSGFSSSSSASALPCCGCLHRIPTELSRKVFTVIGRLLMKTYMKVIVLSVALGLLVFGFYGASQLEQDFDIRWFIPDSSYLQEYYDWKDTYFAVGTPLFIYTKDFDYYANSDKLYASRELLLTADYLSGSAFDWHYAFQSYLNDSAISIADADSFYTNLQLWMVPPSTGVQYSGVIAWNSESAPTAGIAGAFQIGGYTESAVKDAAAQVSAMYTVRSDMDKITKDADEMFAFTFQMLFWEQYAVIADELWRNLALAVCVVFVIALILIPRISAALLVLLSVCASIVDVLGFMWLWGLSIDAVTVCYTVIAIGLAVDYSAHVGEAFMVSAAGSKHARVVDSLHRIGASVFNGAFSTFLAVVAMANSQTYVFRIFFQQFFLVTLLGSLHGLIVLPVLLSLFGPSEHIQIALAHQHSKEDSNHHEPQHKDDNAEEEPESEPVTKKEPTELN